MATVRSRVASFSHIKSCPTFIEGWKTHVCASKEMREAASGHEKRNKFFLAKKSQGNGPLR